MTSTERLFEAIAAGDEAALRQLLDAGADPETARTYEAVVDRDRRTGRESLLHAAVGRGHAALVQLLLQHGADPNVTDSASGASPLLLACEQRRPDLTALLLAAGATPAAATIQAAVWSGDVALAQAVVAAGGAVDLGAALPTAAMGGHAAMLRWLFAQGAEPARDGGAALVEAANAGHADACRFLVQAGAPVDARTTFGWPALHCAAYNGNEATVAALLALGADPTARDDQGRDAASWAEENGKAASLALLQRALRQRA
ncbi:MAG: ankyrin repeat domain-containing protein [Planctomycetes bacterium]|nr:ankyrin repeat domain-containing protein [Planctomycetota bacterium]